MGQAPRSGGVSLRTFNRNFKGRSGTADAQVYLVSPETAAVSALRGKITDPRDLGTPLRVRLPERFASGDTMILPPAPDGEEVEIVRGPNIKPLPRFGALPDVLEAEVLLVVGDNVTTDDILPGGAKVLPLRSNIPAISRYTFSRLDPEFAARAEAAGEGFVLGGKNYGQGSSREHAALAPRYLGVRAVIAQSFSRIHKANLTNFGIIPLEFADERDLARFAVGDRLRLTNLHRSLGEGAAPVLENLSQGFTAPLRLDLSPRFREILLSGGLLAHIRA
jgi:aconitate hydratase